MKKKLRNKSPRNENGNRKLLISIFMVILLAACGKDTGQEHDTYTCPMHPTVISDRPGSCPVCGMDLVRKARTGEEVAITEDLAKLLRSPNETVVASVRTIKGQYKTLPVSVETQGVVTYDTRNIFTIPSRVGGRIEKIFLKYAYQPVSKGQKIAEIYSPELITAQRELLFLLENDPDNTALIKAAKNKLELSGLTSSQIEQLVIRKEPGSTFNVYSPYSGYLMTGQPSPPASSTTPSAEDNGGGMDAMGGTSSAPATSSSSTPSSGSIIREGDYVTPGQTLFRVVSNDGLRIELDLPARQSVSVKKGDQLELDFGTGSKVQGSVDLVQPFFSQGENFLKLRVYTKKTEGLHIGHLVRATISLPASESLWVPKEAVLDLGSDKIVFIKARGLLKPKKIITGISSEGQVEILSGLSSSDEIAENAQYLVDSESFIKVN